MSSSTILSESAGLSRTNSLYRCHQQIPEIERACFIRGIYEIDEIKKVYC